MKGKPKPARIRMLEPTLKTADTRRIRPAEPAMFATVEEDFYVLLDRPINKLSKVMSFQTPDIPDHVRCCNPRCKGGGLDLGRVIRFQGIGDHLLQCDGREGSRSDPRCDNHWNVIVKIKGQRIKR